MMTSVSNSLILTGNNGLHLSSGSSLKLLNQNLGSANPTFVSLNTTWSSKIQPCTSRRSLTIQAAYSDGGRSNNSSILVGGFVLGGIIVGTLGFVYAPQISRALAGTDKKDLMKKLPKFIYDEEKALEKTRKVVAKKIAQLNSAIDKVSGQLKPEDSQML